MVIKAYLIVGNIKRLELGESLYSTKSAGYFVVRYIQSL